VALCYKKVGRPCSKERIEREGFRSVSTIKNKCTGRIQRGVSLQTAAFVLFRNDIKSKAMGQQKNVSTHWGR